MAKCQLCLSRCSPSILIPSIAALVTTGLTALGLGLYVVAAQEGGLFEMVPGKGARYCEEIQEHEAVRTPVNSWSNLVIALAGGWAIGMAIQQYREGVALPRIVLLLCIGLSQVILCVGSFFFHAVLNSWGHWLDICGMYWIMNAALASAAWRWWECIRPPNKCVRRMDLSCMIILLLVADYYMSVARLSLNTVFGSQFCVVAFSELLYTVYLHYSKTNVRYRLLLGVLGLSLLGAALAFRFEGIKAKKANTSFCNPWSLFQPHAVWHVLNGFALIVQNDVQMGPCSFPSVEDDEKETSCFSVAPSCHREQDEHATIIGI
eukprot:TRINITY_DN3633_c0_g1_i3.p1 TRINITY_DN3633_c0_g1~~TRINITY_DN3633_c0_g1_i3.p1  ORF type:complete len:336 (-),score=8.60 TRINITY_DN3633_c0_g1_i3:421-1380(-)